MATLRWFVGLSMSVVLVFSASAQEKKKPLAIEDLYLMESVKSPALFPKEEKLIYERVWIDAKTKEERHSLWIVEGKRENRKPLEKGEPDGRSPVVSPDGEWIAFLSTREYRPRRVKMELIGSGLMNVELPPEPDAMVPSLPPYSDAAVDIWLYQVKTGKVRPLRGLLHSWARVFHDGFYGRVAFSPNSKRLVFVADDLKERRTKQEIQNKVEIVRPDQGEGYTGYGPAQIWIADLPSEQVNSKITRVTDDDIWYGDPQWSPDGKSLVVVANKSKDRESVRYSINKNFDLYLIDVESKKQTQLTTNPGPDVSPRWSPDGKQIAYLSSPRNGPHRDVFNVNIVALRDGARKTRVVFGNLMKADPELFDILCPAFPLPDQCWLDDRHIGVVWEGDNWTNIIDIDLEREVKREDAVKMETNHFQKKRARMLQLRHDINEVLDKRMWNSGNTVVWKSDDFEITGIVTTPPADVARPPYKLIVYPHGGPHSRANPGFDFTVQLFAAHGYAVFQPNFRGSTGYGKKFLDADRLDLGGGDMRDILTGIDQLVEDGKVDPKRQFVYGISYGGFMTSWLVGHTNQFKAAVAQNAVTDMNMMYALSDLQSWTTWELGGTPWEQPERYKKHSPITYANKVKTPTLILHARDDRRCPLPMGKAFHQALVANGVATQMVIYPDEGHGIRQPRHREDVYRRVLEWFAKYDVK